MRIYLELMMVMMAMDLLLVDADGNHSKIWKPLELKPLDWWENTVIYEVLVQSFKDSDGDGLGDLKGVTSKLTHFVDAGVGTIWLSPIFESPMVDFGYDISDFYSINHEFGSMADFEELLEKAHNHGIKVLLDFVPNHASTQCDYFKRSEARDIGYEDYFVWADPKPDPTNFTNQLLPSNWDSRFTGSTWEWSEKRQQYYLHQFTVSQADFNLRSPAVRKELINIMTYWLEKGVDGFRADALNYLFEANPDDYGGMYPDQPIASKHLLDDERSNKFKIHTRDLLENYIPLYEWREFLNNWHKNHGGPTRVILTEAYGNVSRTMMYYGGYDDKPLGAHFPFNFDLITEINEESNAHDFVYVIQRWLTYMPHGRVANWELGNHDRRRVSSVFGSIMIDGLNSLIMMLPGVAITYQGEEIGMKNVPVSLEQTKDTRVFQMGSLEYSRDAFRTPFQWDNRTSAGFSTNSHTWLPTAEDYRSHNLQAQKLADRSHFKVYKSLTRFRNIPAVSHGKTHIRPLTKYTILLVRYLKTYESYALLFNVGPEDDVVDLSRDSMLHGPMIVCVVSIQSTRSIGDTISPGAVTLRPGEALVLRLPAT